MFFLSYQNYDQFDHGKCNFWCGCEGHSLVAKADSVGRVPEVTTQLIFRNVLIHSHYSVNFDQKHLRKYNFHRCC